MTKKLRILLMVLMVALCFPSMAYAADEMADDETAAILNTVPSSDFTVSLRKPTYYFEGDPYEVTAVVSGGNVGDTYTYKWQAHWGISSSSMEWRDLTPDKNNSYWYRNGDTDTFGYMTSDEDGSVNWEKDNVSSLIEGIRCVVTNQNGVVKYSSSFKIPQPSPKQILDMAFITDFEEPIIGVKLDTDVNPSNLMCGYVDIDRVEWYKGSDKTSKGADNTSALLSTGTVAQRGEKYTCRVYLKSNVVIEDGEPVAYRIGPSTRVVAGYTNWFVDIDDYGKYYMSKTFTPSNKIVVTYMSGNNCVGSIKDNVKLEVVATNVDAYQWQIYTNGTWTNITPSMALSFSKGGKGMMAGANTTSLTFGTVAGTYKFRCVMTNDYGENLTSDEFTVTMYSPFKLSVTDVKVKTDSTGQITVSNPNWMEDSRYIWMYKTDSMSDFEVIPSSPYFKIYESVLRYKNIPEALLDDNLKVYCITGYLDGSGQVSSETATFTKANPGEDYTGIKRGDDGTWYYYTDGVIDTTKTGVVKNDSGLWYVKNGKIDFTKRGVVEDGGVEYVVYDGYISTGFYGLTKKADGTWAYAEAGVLTYAYTGLANNEAGWWYVTNGVIDFSFTGIGSNATGDYRVVNGQIDFKYDGWFSANGKWWYIKGGMVDKTKTGLVKKDDAYFYVENGEINFNYTGFAENAGVIYYVKYGYLDFSFSGEVTIGGVTYTVINGIVQMDN